MKGRPRLNVRLLRKVRDAIARTRANTRRQFDMDWWGTQKNGEEWSVNTVGQLLTSVEKSEAGECKTACCLAGHAVVQAGAKYLKRKQIGKRTQIGKAAQRLLGLTEEEAFYLFQGVWTNAGGPTSRTTRGEATAYLDRCIAAGEIVRD